MENKNKRIPFKVDKFFVFVYVLVALFFALQFAVMIWGASL